MKKLFYSCLILIAILMGCEKDSTVTFDHTLILGNWERIDIYFGKSYTEYLEFTRNAFRVKKIYSSYSTTTDYIDYRLDGKYIIAEDKVEYEIEYLSSTLLKLTDLEGLLSEYKKPE